MLSAFSLKKNLTLFSLIFPSLCIYKHSFQLIYSTLICWENLIPGGNTYVIKHKMLNVYQRWVTLRFSTFRLVLYYTFFKELGLKYDHLRTDCKLLSNYDNLSPQKYLWKGFELRSSSGFCWSNPMLWRWVNGDPSVTSWDWDARVLTLSSTLSPLPIQYSDLHLHNKC